MANVRDTEMKLPSLDELFSSQEERDDAKLKRMMDMREFISKVRTELPEFLPEDIRSKVTITEMEITKMNDEKLHGITVRIGDSNAAPTIYLDDMYERYTDGEDWGVMMTHFAVMCTESTKVQAPPDVDLSWENVKDKLSVRLVEKQRNRDFLSDKPYADVGNGLALVADINMASNAEGEWRIAVTHGVMQEMGISKSNLFMAAMDNSIEKDPPVLADMSQMLFGTEKENLLEGDVIPSEGGMYVLTTESANLGACALVYPEVKEKAAEIIGCGYYVLPSSQHEVILVPDSAGVDPAELSAMVKQANRSVVENKDILSDNVLHYDRDERRLTKVSPEPERSDRVAEAR